MSIKFLYIGMPCRTNNCLMIDDLDLLSAAATNKKKSNLFKYLFKL